MLPTILVAALAVLTLPSSVTGSPAPQQGWRSLPAEQAVFSESADGASGGVGDDDESRSATTGIPSRYYSTLLARRLLAQSPVGQLTTVFPSEIDESERTPASVAAAPIALPEYVGDCEGTGDPTLIALDVSTSTRNARHGASRNVSLTVDWWSQYGRLAGHEPWATADLPRLALLGRLEEIAAPDVDAAGIVACFEARHPDARFWRPGSKGSAHAGAWARVRVHEAYWIGGFGDRHYIGWLDIDEWRRVTPDQWKRVRLPGEKW